MSKENKLSTPEETVAQKSQGSIESPVNDPNRVAGMGESEPVELPDGGWVVRRGWFDPDGNLQAICVEYNDRLPDGGRLVEQQWLDPDGNLVGESIARYDK